MGLQVALPGVESRNGDRGGSVREAGTEKTKWWSAVQAGGRTHTESADKLKLCGSKGQTSEEAIDDYTQGIRHPFHLLCHWQAELHLVGAAMPPCSSISHSASISRSWNQSTLLSEEIWKCQWRTQKATHHPWGSSRQGAVGWSSSPWRGTVPGTQSLAHRGGAGCWEGCTLGDGVTNVSSTIKMIVIAWRKKNTLWQSE